MTPELHSEALVIDSHNDTAVGLIRRGNLGLAGESSPERRRRIGAVAYVRQQFDPPERPLQVTLPRLREGGIDAGYFAVDTTIARNNHLLYALDALGYLKREVESHSGEASIALSAADIEDARAAGRFAVVLAVENSAALQHSLYALDALYEIGVRTMTLTHSARTEAADGCEVEGGGGLTGFGREVVRRMNEIGMLVDVSHLNERGFWDVLDCSTAPVVASHSCCRALCDHPRNLADEQLRALGEAGGVVGITFVPYFIDEGLTSTFASSAFAFFGFGAMLGRPFWGYVASRFGVHASLTLWGFGYSLAIALYVLADTPTTLFAAAWPIGLVIGGSQQLQSQAWPDYFGRRHVGAITGLTVLLVTPAMALGPVVTALAFDLTGSYEPVHTVYVVGAFFAGFFFLAARRPRRKATSPLPTRGEQLG